MKRSEADKILRAHCNLAPSILSKMLDSFSDASNGKIRALDYEISVDEGSAEIGLQANPVYDPKELGPDLGRMQQQKTIIEILGLLNKRTGSSFDARSLRLLFPEGKGAKGFIFHFGYEISSNMVPRFKIYCIPERNIANERKLRPVDPAYGEFLGRLTSFLGLKSNPIPSMNAYGIDCHADGRNDLKIYVYRDLRKTPKAGTPFTAPLKPLIRKYGIKDSDVLYRIGPVSRPKGVSKVYIYPKPALTLTSLKGPRFKKLLERILAICDNIPLAAGRLRVTALAANDTGQIQAYLS